MPVGSASETHMTRAQFHRALQDRTHAAVRSAARVLFAGSALISATLAVAAEPPPVPGGRIGTLAIGRYSCELPGDAGGIGRKPVPEYDFRIVNSSSYKIDSIRGSYLYTGDHVTMTGGKLKGMKFHRVSTGFLRQVHENGEEGPLRCVLASRNY